MNMKRKVLIQNSCNKWQKARLQRKTFVAMLVLSLGFALLLSGCERPTTGGEGIDKQVADLGKQVETLKEQNRDLRAKLGAAHGFGRSPLEDFFASPEFWECTYDSSWADCSGRCTKQTSEGYSLCLQKPEGPERTNCINDNTARGQACLKACPVQTSPTDPPGC